MSQKVGSLHFEAIWAGDARRHGLPFHSFRRINKTLHGSVEALFKGWQALRPDHHVGGTGYPQKEKGCPCWEWRWPGSDQLGSLGPLQTPKGLGYWVFPALGVF